MLANGGLALLLLGVGGVSARSFVRMITGRSSADIRPD